MDTLFRYRAYYFRIALLRQETILHQTYNGTAMETLVANWQVNDPQTTRASLCRDT